METGTNGVGEALDTTEAFRIAMKVLRDAEVPESLWPTALPLPLALADLRGVLRAKVSSANVNDRAPAKGAPKRSNKAKSKPKNPSSQRATSASDALSILIALPDEDALFKAVEKETQVSVSDLADLFHVEAGAPHIKAPSKDLGSTKKAGAQTITALVAGLVFAGTPHRKLSFKEVADVCRAKHVFDSANSAASIRTTPGFGSVGAGPTNAIVTKTGWQAEFSKAVQRALKKPTETDG
jgi:hypothetical protein